MLRSFINNERVKAGFTSALALFALIGIWLQSRGNVEGGQDSWNHYLIARFATKHPQLFLDQWGKPLFTLIASPFCQLGFSGLIVFNIFCTVLTGWICFLCARRLGYNNAWLAVAIATFSPVLFGNSISGLTEPLNALALSIAVLLWIYKRKNASLILISFLPFFRSEGFVIIGALILFLLVSKQFKRLPLLLVGSILFCIIGRIYFNNWTWIIGDNPYIRAGEQKASYQEPGRLIHYLRHSCQIWGFAGSALLFAGFTKMIVSIREIKNSSVVKKHYPETLLFEIFFLCGIIVAYFAAHTFIFWKGMLGSEGLYRVMAVIVPCTSLIALKGWNYLSRKTVFLSNKRLLNVLIFILLFIGAYRVNYYVSPLKYSTSPVKEDPGLDNYNKAESWLRQEGLAEGLLIHQLPSLNVRMNKDPLDIKQTYFIWSINKEDDWTPKNAIVFWDGYFSGREGRMPLKWLQENPNYELLKLFKEDNYPKGQMGWHDIYIFRKVR
ncbi:MAG: hypothetical protein H7321_02835 [Bacteroidia bacterium]|nr:hypothetical protein [Bacteroidia bacterium]